MLPASIDYEAPGTLADAIATLASDPAAVIIGASPRTVIDLKMRRSSARRVVDLRRIAELRGIVTEGAGRRIGSMSTLRTMLDDQTLRSDYAGLAEAAGSNGDAQMRNMETLLGCLTRDLATSGVAAALMALDATVRLVGPRGERTVPMADLVAQSGPVAPDRGEILTAVVLPRPPSASAYAQVAHPATLDPVCGVAACLTLGDEGAVARCAFAVTGATDRPSRLSDAEAAVLGRSLGDESVRAAAAVAAAGLDLVADRYASAEYREQLVSTLLGRVLVSAASAVARPA